MAHNSFEVSVIHYQVRVILFIIVIVDYRSILLIIANHMSTASYSLQLTDGLRIDRATSDQCLDPIDTIFESYENLCSKTPTENY